MCPQNVFRSFDLANLGLTQSPAIWAAKRDCDWLPISGITPQV
ncbi:hypothetical protein ACPOL_6941 (plasmid) [Acidisarcina polymorpha]|uniref:Uncharacterized protein n=1 Tax=Acidisarcina polymorpha TaxID=2211140 RepID=A0A2Z5GC14_9BACT|nr:hypothetical protein ACPOL_6941 [Acidisarcina polymorpha]